ncbi:MAG: carbohydrate ABC transporter permease [Actinomycetota bacterium]
MTTLTHRRPRRPHLAHVRVPGWLMLAPALLAVAVVALYPLAYTFAVSVTQSSLGQPFQEFVGGANFATILSEGASLDTALRSLAFALPSAALAVVLGAIVALAMNGMQRTGRLARALILLPLMTPPVMAAVIWRLMMAPTGGLLNNILRSTDVVTEPVLFLGTTPAAMMSLIVVDVWQWMPFCVLLVYAGLQALPSDVYEAAQVDGASPARTLWSITLPLLMPTLITVLLLKVIVSFKVFDLVFIMTSGGPGLDTTVASYDIYKSALQQFNLGAAGAQTIVFLVLVTVVVLPLAALRDRALKGAS